MALLNIPHEIQHLILLHISAKDIINYCLTCRQLRRVFYDPIFWLYKLDHDFTNINREGQVCQPRNYVTVYPHDNNFGYCIYKKWHKYHIYSDIIYIMTCDLRKNHMDIEMFAYDMYNTDNISDTMFKIINTGNLQLLQHIANKKYGRPVKFGYWYANIAAGNNHIHILQWFESQGIYATETGANLAAMNNHIAMLEYLLQQGTKPNYEGANDAMKHNAIEASAWMSEHGIYINLKHKNHYNGSNIIRKNLKLFFE